MVPGFDCPGAVIAMVDSDVSPAPTPPNARSHKPGSLVHPEESRPAERELLVPRFIQ
jgi:hypothetical protein